MFIKALQTNLKHYCDTQFVEYMICLHNIWFLDVAQHQLVRLTLSMLGAIILGNLIFQVKH